MASIEPYPHDWKEARRWRALELSQQGWPQCQIAGALGVSRPAVSQWLAAVRGQGNEALRARPHTGSPPKLAEEQLHLLPDFLSHGAEAYGFRGQVWTCARIAKVIRWEFGVAYSRSHVSRLMEQLAWSPQKPLERASQRDEVRIATWRTDVWPELKKRPGASAANSFLWMNRAFTCCRRWLEPMPRAERRRSCRCFRPMTICR